MKKLIIVLLMLCAALSVTSCNTAKGIGRDVEAVGDSVQDAVN